MNYADYVKMARMIRRDGEKNLELAALIKSARCPKCVYEGECRSFDKGDCKKYKRNPPDGGYYG